MTNSSISESLPESSSDKDCSSSNSTIASLNFAFYDEFFDDWFEQSLKKNNNCTLNMSVELIYP